MAIVYPIARKNAKNGVKWALGNRLALFRKNFSGNWK
jgi:hypothetical protein